MSKKTIKVAFYRISITLKKDRDKSQKLPLYTFRDVLKQLASKLDGNNNKQIITLENNELETSIWFDSFNHKNIRKDICKNCIAFLLAKDVLSVMEEDKETQKLAQKESQNDNVHLKIPAHFLYFSENEIIGVEEIQNSATKSTLSKAIKQNTDFQVKFIPINKTNLLERLKEFQDSIQQVEFNFKDFSDLFNQKGREKDFIEFIKNNDSKFHILTDVTNKDSKSFVFKMFKKMFSKSKNSIENNILNNIINMKVHFLNKDSQQETIELLENFVVYKADREYYLNNMRNIENKEERRLEYSKEIYKVIIDFYNEYRP